MKHELRKTFAALFLVLCLCLTAGLFASCRQPTEAIQIASVLPLTGPAGELGQDIKRGHELAAEYFNGRPDRTRQVQFVFEDSKSNPPEGVKAVQSLLARGQRLFIVNLSTVVMAVKPALVEARAFAFLDAAHPGVTQPPNPLIFRHSQTAEAEAGLIIPAATAGPGAQKLAFFYLNDEYGRSFLNALHATKVSVPVSEHPYEAATTDFRTLVQASGVGADKGTAVIAVGVGRPLGLLIKSLREQGYKGMIYTTLGYVATGSRAVLGDDRSGITYVDIGWNDNQATTWMTGQYRTRFSKEPPAVAVIEFQSALLLALSAEGAGGNDPEAVARQVAKFSPSVTGTAPTQTNDIVPKISLRKEE